MVIFVNIVFHEGYLGKDLEVKHLPNGDMYVLLISDENENGEIEWIKHVSFNAFADKTLQQLKKGAKVRVKSRLKHLRWIDPKSSRQRTRLTCVIADIVLCEKSE